VLLKLFNDDIGASYVTIFRIHVVKMWTLLLNGRVQIWNFLRNDFPNTRHKFNRQEFLSNQIVGKPEQREMQSWGKVSSIPGANTLFEGRQTEKNRDKRQIKREVTEIEETSR
jgi:hypothetical protein